MSAPACLVGFSCLIGCAYSWPWVRSTSFQDPKEDKDKNKEIFVFNESIGVSRISSGLASKHKKETSRTMKGQGQWGVERERNASGTLIPLASLRSASLKVSGENLLWRLKRKHLAMTLILKALPTLYQEAHKVARASYLTLT